MDSLQMGEEWEEWYVTYEVRTSRQTENATGARWQQCAPGLAMDQATAEGVLKQFKRDYKAGDSRNIRNVRLVMKKCKVMA